MLKDIELVDILLQQWIGVISIKIIWYQKHIHQVIPGAMILPCLQFVIITKKLFQDVLVFGIAKLFSVATIGNKRFGWAKIGFNDIGDKRTGIWIFLWSLISPIILFYYKLVTQKFLLYYWCVIRKVLQKRICCCILRNHVNCSVQCIITHRWFLFYILYLFYLVIIWISYILRFSSSKSLQSID